MSEIRIEAEYTDTFGGDANYSWVRRAELKEGSDLSLVRQAKKAFGLNGVRCKREDWGDMIILRPYGYCRIVFIFPVLID